MTSFSGFERNVARFLGRSLFVKKKVKKIYQIFQYLLHRKVDRVLTELEVKVCGKKDFNESFFGYYDKSPNNIYDQVIQIDKDDDFNDLGEVVSGLFLRVYDKDSVIFSEKIDAYNYQQGCRAHWLTDDKFIFNTFCHISSRVIAKVVSVRDNLESRILWYPVQDSYKDEFYISLNYERLNAITPEYGYPISRSVLPDDLSRLDNDGLWIIDFLSGLSKRFLSLKEILSCGFRGEFRNAKHLVNHVMISPNGRACIFIHRFFHDGKRIDRLMHWDLNSFELNVLVDNGFVSHCCWLDHHHILGFFRNEEGIDCFNIIDLETSSISGLGDSQMMKLGDGHPSCRGDFVVFDSYPDRARMQSLVLCNWKTGEWRLLGQFYSGLNFVEEKRCDLHPRFSKVDDSIFIDGTFRGYRQLYRVFLNGF